MRGAALVEAAVVIPVMLVFLGLIVFVHKAYDTKIVKQTNTRATTLYYASHNCKGNVPDSLSPSGVGTSSQADPVAGDGTVQKGGSSTKLDATAGLQTAWNYAHVKPEDTTVTGSASNDRKIVSLSRNVHSESEVYCNEDVWSGALGNNPITAVYAAGKELFSQGAAAFGF